MKKDFKIQEEETQVQGIEPQALIELRVRLFLGHEKMRNGVRGIETMRNNAKSMSSPISQELDIPDHH